MAGVFAGSLSRRRARAAAAARGPLAQYYRAAPPPDDTNAPQLPLLAIDLECTSLDLPTAQILSIGWVPVESGRLRLEGSHQVVINTGRAVGDSVVIHGLTDDVIAAGAPLPEAIEQVLVAAAGRVLLAHHAVIETTLLSRACEQLFGAPLVTPVIDTLVLQRQLAHHDPAGGPGLTLPEARARYGLPRYRAHDALTDAVACGELFLAQMAQWPATKPPALKSLRQR